MTGAGKTKYQYKILTKSNAQKTFTLSAHSDSPARTKPKNKNNLMKTNKYFCGLHAYLPSKREMKFFFFC